MCHKVLSPFVFNVKTIRGVLYLDTPELYVVTYLEEMQQYVTRQHEGVLSHWNNIV
jgi:hypothetical protein